MPFDYRAELRTVLAQDRALLRRAMALRDLSATRIAGARTAAERTDAMQASNNTEAAILILRTQIRDTVDRLRALGDSNP